MDLQALDLWRIGGPLYAPQEYQRYQAALGKAKENLFRERSRLFFLRDYGQVQAEFNALLKEGEALRARIETEKNSKALEVRNQIAASKARIETLRQLASMINEGYLAGKALTRAELLLTEATHLSERGEFGSAWERLKSLSGDLKTAQAALAPIFARYADQGLQAKWQRWVTETVDESRRRGKFAIVVNKFDRLLFLYHGGRIVKTYPVAIGRYGSFHKLRAGDYATPEGKYSIIQKRPRSKYFRALLINYPNEEDKREFLAAKRRGQIPGSIGIGGLVEIHGGGKDGMTYGCIALDDNQMAELFDTVEVGTPVTIVGSTDAENEIPTGLTGK